MEYESKGIEIIREMRAVIAEAEAIGPWIDGQLLKNKRTKYVRRTAASPTIRRCRFSSTGWGPGSAGRSAYRWSGLRRSSD